MHQIPQLICSLPFAFPVWKKHPQCGIIKANKFVQSGDTHVNNPRLKSRVSCAKLMTIGDILVNTNRANLNNLLPLSEVKTKKDFAKFKKNGYTVGMTAGEFQEKYPLLPIENIYASYNILSSLYYCEPQNPTIPIVLNLQIYGDKRLSVANESDEAFQNRILSIAKAISEGNVKRIRSYLFSLEDSFRVSVLSQYIKNAEPSTELYDLFMDYYKLTDYGFKNLNEADIRKVLSGKSEEQKKKTAEKLRKFPDTITVYRGEGSKSTPYTQSFSWTVSYKAACFFACRLPSAEDSTIVSAEVSKDDIIEFFPERNEAEVVILPSALPCFSRAHHNHLSPRIFSYSFWMSENSIRLLVCPLLSLPKPLSLTSQSKAILRSAILAWSLHSGKGFSSSGPQVMFRIPYSHLPGLMMNSLSMSVSRSSTPGK